MTTPSTKPADLPAARLPAPASGLGRGAGLVLSAALGIYLIVLGVFSIGDTQSLLTLALFGFGVSLLLLGRGAQLGLRAPWAFLVAVNGALVIAYTFGAPTLRNAAEISLLLAMFPALLHAAATVALISARRDYR